MNLRWLLRMARWAHRPPSWQMVMLVLAVIALALMLAGIERFVGWPDWLRPSGDVRGRPILPR